MPTHSESRILPYSAKQMYDLVADIERYPDFLPWCAAARVCSRVSNDQDVILKADLVISFKIFKEKFGSRVILSENAGKISTEYIDGPFKFMKSNWIFRDVEDGCEIKFFVDFELRNLVLQRIIGVVFNEAMQRIVRAFEKRAHALYV